MPRSHPRTIAATLCVLALAAAAAADDDAKKKYPKLVRFQKTRVNALPHYAYELPKGVEPSETPGAVKATVAGTKIGRAASAASKRARPSPRLSVVRAPFRDFTGPRP